MIRKFFICIIYILLTAPLLAQQGPVTFTYLQDSMAVHPKPIVIKIYTDWCSYCKMQDRQIERSPAVQQLLSEKYYYVALNAESRQPIVFNDTTYSFIPYGTQGVHALAAKLMQHHAAYPAWVVLDTSYRTKALYTGMLKDKLLLEFLRTIE
ncbi:thioredoxin family protein [Chitinophaga filiformis]|uniref:Thioredoxin-like n=1 Tax=Chitinophaga filiformis TaxID=104663 RepID=A0A1G7HUG1_CHIFI|nr:thioredoxin family protein [Chitinophaga filiformis]SDF04147.1 Thioredoxin-like [Chitinophaga filiformis]